MASSLLLLKLVTYGNDYVHGDCQMAGLENLIPVESFSWGIARSKTNDTKKVILKSNEMKFSKAYDHSSPVMAKVMEKKLDKPHYEKAIFMFIDPMALMRDPKGGPDKVSIMQLEVNNVYIKSINISASEGGKMVSVKEDISLTFSSDLSLRYFPHDAKGNRASMDAFNYRVPEAFLPQKRS